MKPNPSSASSRKIVVVGGTGLIGQPLVRALRDLGHDVVVAAPSQGINAVTGEGLAAALAGAHTVIDVSNSPSFEPAAVLDFFTRSTGNLVDAGRAAGIRHFVALSVVGADRLPDSGYLVAKVAQEKLIRGSDLPWTIVRATQFFEFAGAIAQAATQDGVVRVPPIDMQPIAAADVSATLADVALAAPANRIVDLAGPERLTQAEFVRRQLGAAGDPRPVVVDPVATYFGARAAVDSLVPLGAASRLAPTRQTDWLAKRAPVAASSPAA